VSRRSEHTLNIGHLFRGSLRSDEGLFERTLCARFVTMLAVEQVTPAVRVLVLGAGPSQLALLAAARREGLLVVAADRDPAAPGFRYADRRALVGAEDEPAVERLARAEGAEAIVGAASDRAAAVAARVAQRIGIPHPIAPQAAAAIASPERRRAALLEAGVPLVEPILCRSDAEAKQAVATIGLPCALFPVEPLAQGRIEVVRRRAEAARAASEAIAASRTGACTVAALAQDAVVVTGFAVAGRVHPLTVCDRHPGQGPTTSLVWPSALAPPEVGAAVEVAAAAAAAVGIDEGSATAVVLFFPDGPRLGDLSCRSGDDHEAELCRAAVGVDLNLLTLKLALGEPVGAHELAAARRAGGACVRLLSAPRGELRSVRGVEEAFALEGVAGIRIYHRPGAVFARPTRAGAVLATGETRDEATARAERAAARIRFHTVRTNPATAGGTLGP
jgi:formate-dependent phosphoribosylglycinamide formyltransferase (GAR transformylase)